MTYSKGPQCRGIVVCAVMMLAVLAGCRRGDGSTLPQPVLAGVDVLFRDSLHLMRDRRVGLITNDPARGAGRSTIDRFHEHPDIDLVKLFAPEHGLRATAGEGRLIDDERDPATGLPVISVYGRDKRAPTASDLEGLDVVVFDMQDVGARYYTYIYTMALAMEAVGEVGLPFVVLDRPNPIGGAVQGNVLDSAFASFVGLYPIPMRHGLTVGELARLFRARFGVEVDLTVVPLDGWDPSMLYADTGLPWLAPSPNMPNPLSALHYPGTCLFEGTNLSVGRGTDRPFQQVGAPWLDATVLAERLAARALPGVRFEPVRFTPHTPSDGKWSDTEVSGVRFVVTDDELYDPTRAAVAVLVEARALAGAAWQWNTAHFDRLAGTDALRLGIEAGATVAELTSAWSAEQAVFEMAAEPLRLYPR